MTQLILYVSSLQCNILRKGLDAHRKRVTQAIEPLHQHMEAKYAEMRKTYFPQEIPKDPPRKVCNIPTDLP